MAKQTINQGAAPTGAGGDTFRSGSAKLQANDNELYNWIGNGSSVTTLPASLPVAKGGTGATTVAAAKINLGLNRFTQNPGVNTAIGAPSVDAAITISDAGWGVYKGDAPGFSRSLNIVDGGTGATTAAAARTNLGLGDAATRSVGTSAGNVMQVGAFGFGSNSRYQSENPATQATSAQLDATQMYGFGDTGPVGYGHGLGWSVAGRVHFVLGGFTTNHLYHAVIADKNAATRSVGYHVIRTAQNTTVDSNGFLKNASPIVELYADKIELNDEAKLQNITFEKLGIGDYLIKNSSGFAQEGWYIETPKDANGNLLVAVVYEQLENGDISVKTYDYMLNNKGRIVADTETPLDIPEARWIDLRLQELPQPEIEVTDDPEQ